MTSCYAEWRASLGEINPTLAQAVDTARAAIAEMTDETSIGEHLGVVAEGAYAASHIFECRTPGYPGWYWTAILALVPGSETVTVSETALLPGEDALVAPEWVPWKDRLRPSDIGARDVLPKVENDPNLELGLEQVKVEPEDNIDQIPNFEFGLGRKRVLSRDGIAAAAARWAESDSGPDSEYAVEASAKCRTCGFLMPIAGSVRTQFGLCANAASPFDGRVVSLSNGCGAHSETDVRRHDDDTAEPVIDDRSEDFEMVAAGVGEAGDGESRGDESGREVSGASGGESGREVSGASDDESGREVSGASADAGASNEGDDAER